MTEREAGFTTLREFNLKVKARQEAEHAKWELARWQMFLALQMQPFIKQHSKPKNVQAWIRFPWEKAQDITADDAVVTADEIAKLNALKTAFFNNKKTT